MEYSLYQWFIWLEAYLCAAELLGGLQVLWLVLDDCASCRPPLFSTFGKINQLFRTWASISWTNLQVLRSHYMSQYFSTIGMTDKDYKQYHYQRLLWREIVTGQLTLNIETFNSYWLEMDLWFVTLMSWSNPWRNSYAIIGFPALNFSRKINGHPTFSCTHFYVRDYLHGCSISGRRSWYPL